ncbi:sulfatase [Prolixibacteraceae bacterium Z1-6]|uniref:Sulfatase n=1 Tax=Draconibacterium aestuarii TaxID=2998507 RepID=A0A9X3F2I4_9BACT|nr:sulfatase [Prolixibacteraceae bacterium Z1-6]
MKLIAYFIILSTVLCSCAKQVKDTKPETKPNLLFIFADQYRKASLGFLNEDPVQTPNIDNLAENGVFFSRAVSNHPLCSPYRGMLFTGKYPLANGVIANCNSGRTAYGNYLKKDEVCFSDVLAENGYSAGYVGKWHLDGPEPTLPGETVEWDTWCPPENRHGFSFWHAYGTHGRHNNPYYWTTHAAEGEKLVVNKWSPEHEADVIIDYLKNTEHQRINEKPFALFWSINPPHTPFGEVPEKYKQQFAGKDYKQLLNRDNVKFTTNNDLQRGDKGVETKIDQAPDYFACVNGVDDQIGRVISALKEQGLYENTIIVFTADHGEMLGSQGLMHKNVWFKEAYYIPLIVHFPKTVKSKTEDIMISVPDYMPTMLGLMGLGNQIPAKVEGVDYSNVFFNKAVIRPDKQLYFGSEPSNSSSGARGFRNAQYTFAVVKANGQKYYYLYNDINDPFQMVNIWGNNKDLDEKMEQELNELLFGMNDPWIK